jgi:hypothetical protein
MMYLAHDAGSHYHAADSREKVETKDGWCWTGKARCGKSIKGISGQGIVSLINCRQCQKILREEGWEF